MSQIVTLSYYTCAPIAPLEQIRLAKTAGYNGVGLRPSQPRPDAPVQSIFADKSLIRDIKHLGAELDIRVFDLEFMWLDAAFDVDRCKGLVELGAELGVEALLVGGMDPEWSRMAENFGKLCAFVAEGGLAVDLEFMPWAKLSSLAGAVRLIRDADNPANGKLLLDALHFFRANTPVEELAALPAGIVHSVQICDDILRPAISPTEARQVANAQRLPPGAGALDLVSFIRALPEGTPMALEVPNPLEIERQGTEAWARLCLGSLQTLLENLDGS